MRLLIADCSVDYSGRLSAHLPKAKRLIMFKADGSVLIHSDGGSYKPLNWMMPPLSVEELDIDAEHEQAGVVQLLDVRSAKTDDRLRIRIYHVYADVNEELGAEPGLTKDGVEAHLQELLAQQIELLGPGHRLIRREYYTAIGPVDILAKDADDHTVAVEIKRVGGIDGVEQLTRYRELLDRDPLLAPVKAVFAAQSIKPQARTLAEDRGITCLILDYDAMRGMDDADSRLF